jgi:hypothetical protein
VAVFLAGELSRNTRQQTQWHFQHTVPYPTTEPNSSSFEVSHNALGRQVIRPQFVRDLDLVEKVWPEDLRPTATTSSNITFPTHCTASCLSRGARHGRLRLFLPYRVQTKDPFCLSPLQKRIWRSMRNGVVVENINSDCPTLPTYERMTESILSG